MPGSIAIGASSEGLSRTNDSLVNEIERKEPNQNLIGSTQVEYSATFTAQGVEEVGLFDSSDNLIVRSTCSNTDVDGTVSLTLDVSNDPNVDSGVVTETGQEAVRDIIADNSPTLPTQYAYGSDDTAPSETDTSLATQVVAVDLDKLLVQSANSNSDWESITSLDNSPPSTIENGELKHNQSCFTQEGEDFDSGTEFKVTDPSNLADFSGGDAAYLSRGPSTTGGPDNVEYNFTLNYTISSPDFKTQYRFVSNSNGTPAYDVILDHANGTSYTLDSLPLGFDVTTLGWRDTTLGDGEAYSGPDLEPGDYTLRFEATDSDGTADNYYLYIDVVAPYDSSYTYNFDNDNGGSSGYLDGPELFPNLLEYDLSQATTRRGASGASIDSTWNDVSNGQFIAVSPDGTNYTTVNNSETLNTTFAENTNELYSRLGISRYGSRTTATPQTGFQTQAVDVFSLYADILAINANDTGVANVQGVVPPGTITGSVLTEAAQLTDSDTALTRSTFAEFEALESMQIVSSENISFNNP